MRPIQLPPPTATGSASPALVPNNNNRPQRRRKDLTLPLPQRDTNLAVPLPLPPSGSGSGGSGSGSGGSSGGGGSNHQQQQVIPFSELERLNRIGSGSGGTVYKVVHSRTRRVYALKVIYGHHEESVRRQIHREIQILRDVDDSNVVKCHEMYDHNAEIQVLLEYMDGGSLEGKHIRQEQKLADVAREILRGLAYLHRRHIVHRDIKPSNLLINSQKQVKIADFGVGRILNQTMDPCNSSVGTIAYMSPERINTDINDGQYDAYAGDIWSFGVSILEFYMGRFPFAVGRQGDWASLMCAICMSQPPEAPAGASPEFKDFVSRCLQRDPSRRWTASRLLSHPFLAQPVSNHNTPPPNLHQLLPPPPRSLSS